LNSRILIVEDDELVQALLGAYLEKESFKVSLAVTGKEMLSILAKEAIDLILLDLSLPDEDGLTLARQVRARATTPIIVLTARQGREDRLIALEVGADDYMTKPFDPEELILRIRNVLDRASSERVGPANDRYAAVMEFEGWTVDMGAHTVTSPEGDDVPLTRAEFNLLASLVKAPNRVLTRAHLLDAVSQHDDSPSDRMIDVLISRLRKKIEANPKKPSIIITVPGCGYKFTVSRS
jgi:DNA-binding response OmpR family regulator